ncbi:MAG: AI-2E family transporter, partial [Planctomycetota bacterium]
MSRLISFAVLIAIIIIIGLLFYKVLIGFFIPVFLAAVLVVVFRPLHRWVLEKTGHRDRVAAVISTLLIMLTLCLPILVVGYAAASQGLQLIELNDDEYILQARINKIRSSLGLEYPSYFDRIEKTETNLQDVLRRASSADLTAEDSELIKLSEITIKSLKDLEAGVSAPYGPEKWKDESNSTTSALRTQFVELEKQLSELGQPLDEEADHVVRPVTIKAKFSTLKTELLGGQLIALAKRAANPTLEDQQQLTQNLLNYVRPRLLSITGATGVLIVKFIFGFVILSVATFFFLYDGPSMVKTVMRLSP